MKTHIRRLVCLTAALLLVCGICAAAMADGTPNLKTYKKAMDYVKKNQPMSLNLDKVRFTPKELLAIKQAMPEGAELHFSTNWKKLITDTDNSIAQTKHDDCGIDHHFHIIDVGVPIAFKCVEWLLN